MHLGCSCSSSLPETRDKTNLSRAKYVVKYYLQNVGHHESLPDWCHHHWRGLMRDCMASKWSRMPAFNEVVVKLRDVLAALPKSPERTESATTASVKMAISNARNGELKYFIPFKLIDNFFFF